MYGSVPPLRFDAPQQVCLPSRRRMVGQCVTHLHKSPMNVRWSGDCARRWPFGALEVTSSKIMHISLTAAASFVGIMAVGLIKMRRDNLECHNMNTNLFDVNL